jgi:hypothetical protein
MRDECVVKFVQRDTEGGRFAVNSRCLPYVSYIGIVAAFPQNHICRSVCFFFETVELFLYGSGQTLKVPIHVRVWLASPPRGA